MTEKEMEDLLWHYPEKFFAEPVGRFRRQSGSASGRADLILIRLGHLLVVEVKRGTPPREAVVQLYDYRNIFKREFPDAPLALMLVANSIPPDRRSTCDELHIGYAFESESSERPTATGSGAIEQPIGQLVSRDNDQAATRRDWVAQRLTKALEVVDDCGAILSQVQEGLRFFLAETSNGKYANIGEEGRPFITDPEGSEQPLRLDLWKRGPIKISAMVREASANELRIRLKKLKDQQRLGYKLLGGGDKRRIRFSPVTLGETQNNNFRPYLKDLFSESFNWWKSQRGSS
jgi:hypothetical protein